MPAVRHVVLVPEYSEDTVNESGLRNRRLPFQPSPRESNELTMQSAYHGLFVELCDGTLDIVDEGLARSSTKVIISDLPPTMSLAIPVKGNPKEQQMTITLLKCIMLVVIPHFNRIPPPGPHTIREGSRTRGSQGKSQGLGILGILKKRQPTHQESFWARCFLDITKRISESESEMAFFLRFKGYFLFEELILIFLCRSLILRAQTQYLPPSFSRAQTSRLQTLNAQSSVQNRLQGLRKSEIMLVSFCVRTLNTRRERRRTLLAFCHSNTLAP